MYLSWRSYELQKALDMANSLVSSHLSDLYCRGSELQQVMVAWIVETEFSILSLGTFLQAARVGAVERLSFDRKTTACKSRGTILRALLSFIKEWCFFGIL